MTTQKRPEYVCGTHVALKRGEVKVPKEEKSGITGEIKLFLEIGHKYTMKDIFPSAKTELFLLNSYS